MHISTSGHYSIHILPPECHNNVETIEVALIVDTGRISNADIIKIDKQFGHASAENIKRLYQNIDKLIPNLSQYIQEFVLISIKTISTIIKQFLKKWISVFGAPKNVLSDKWQRIPLLRF